MIMSIAHAQKCVSCVGMAITWMSNRRPEATFVNYICTLTGLSASLIKICKRETREPGCTNGYGTLLKKNKSLDTLGLKGQTDVIALLIFVLS
jgi:hypothetical protein